MIPMASQLPIPELRERNLAAASHVSSIFFPIIGPAVAIAISHKRFPFVKCHALSALLDEIILKAILFVGAIVSITMTVYRIIDHYNTKGTTVEWADIWPILIRMGITWIALLLLGLFLTIQSIIQAVRASKGIWPTKGISGRLAMKMASPKSDSVQQRN
jgi:hypothetical protein